jgi:hypothetical protein
MAKEKLAPEFQGSIAAQAWENTRLDTDAPWRSTGESEFWNNLQYAADKVIETGSVRTKFEQEVKELHEKAAKAAKESDALGGNAVIGNLADVEGGAGATAASTVNLPPGSDAPKSEKKAEAAKSDAVKTAAKTDESGHVPSGKEASAAAKSESTAPAKP